MWSPWWWEVTGTREWEMDRLSVEGLEKGARAIEARVKAQREQQ